MKVKPNVRKLFTGGGVVALLVVALVAMLISSGGSSLKLFETKSSLPDVTGAAGDTQRLICGSDKIVVDTSSTAAVGSAGPSAADFHCDTTTSSTMATTTTTTGGGGSAPTLDHTVTGFGASAKSVSVVAATGGVAELAVAFVSSDCPATGSTCTNSPFTTTMSGGSLTWTLAGRANGEPGAAEVWTATTTGAGFTATDTALAGTKNVELTVLTFIGSSGIGTHVNGAGGPSAPSDSVTPTASANSLIYAVGFDFDNATARTVGSGQTRDEQDTDGAGDTYWVQHVNAATTSTSPVTINDTAPTGDHWDFEAVEIEGTGGGGGGSNVAIDGSSPAFTQAAANVGTITSASFSPPASTVLYAVFSMDSCPFNSTLTECTNSGNNMDVASMSSTGTTLTWHEVNLDQATVTNSIGGFVEVFEAANTGAQSGITVTGTFSVNTKNVTAPTGGMKIYVMDNANANQSTAVSTAAHNVTGTSAPTASVTTSAANSLVMSVFDNWDSDATPTVGTGQQQLDLIGNAPDADTYWTQDETSITASASTNVTQNATSPSNIHWHEIAWEVLAA